ncbi:asparagine--tRNA ligase [Candidatus Woesearchaeota archaeon]|nr:asparagine--tRNA ligase [Candidatus Woesearchaeota archaeon]
MFITISEALKQGQGNVELRGWVHRERKSKNKVFIVLRDHTDIIQCVVSEDADKQVWEDANKVLIESSLKLSGEIKKDERAPTGYEVHVKNLELVQIAERFPITKDQSPEFLLDIRHLWLRSQKMTHILKVRATAFKALREFFDKQGYYEFTAPMFTPNACEGGATLFEVKYFDTKVYLTQTWQLYAEAAIFALEKIFTVSPCFRSEKSKTSRHLAEFWMAEVETAWMDLEGLEKQAEDLVSYVVQKVVQDNSKELIALGQDVEKLKKIKAPFPRITYEEALKMLQEDGVKIKFGKDLRTVEEDKLMTHFSTPIIVTNYPKEIMAFYKPEDPKNPKTALCFDMLAPEGYGEIIGGSQRSLDVEDMKKKLAKDGEKVETYDWYFDTRRYGSVPHAGFGMGMERVIAWICKLDNIKDAIPFPRTMLRFKP